MLIHGVFYAHKIFINMDLKRIIKEEMDDFDWIRDINYYKYSIGDTIEPVNGYHYYVNTIDYVKKGPISGHREATVMNIMGDFYEVKFNYNYLSKDMRESEISYYLLIDEVDNKTIVN